MDLERIQQLTPGTLYQQWHEDGAVADPGTVTVAIVRADGSAVSSGNAAGSGTNPRTYNLTAANTALLDRLTVTWTSATKGTLVTYVEVAGGFLFSIAEFRGLGAAYTNTTNYPTSAIQDMRTTVEQSLEKACGVAFVPRYEYETVNGLNAYELPLKWRHITSIRSATVDGTTLTPADLVGLAHGVVYNGGRWYLGYSNVTIGYEHGHDMPPMRMKRAALLLAKRWMTPSSVDDRAINVSNDTGTYALFQAAVRGHQFDVPEVQAAVDEYNLSTGVL